MKVNILRKSNKTLVLFDDNDIILLISAFI